MSRVLQLEEWARLAGATVQWSAPLTGEVRVAVTCGHITVRSRGRDAGEAAAHALWLSRHVTQFTSPVVQQREPHMPQDITFTTPDEQQGERPARVIGPDELGLKSRIDVYMHDGQDGDGEEYGTRATLAFDDAMVLRAARKMNLEAGRLRGVAFKDDWDTITHDERDGWLLVAREGLRAGLTPAGTDA